LKKEEGRKEPIRLSPEGSWSGAERGALALPKYSDYKPSCAGGEMIGR
jgi:hypothetical protein